MMAHQPLDTPRLPRDPEPVVRHVYAGCHTGRRQRTTITLPGWQRCAQSSLILKAVSGGAMLPLKAA
jgi:hypothetical protein